MKAKHRVAIYEIFDHIEALESTNAALLKALENLLRCSEYKATGCCQDCVPAANEAIRIAKQS